MLDFTERSRSDYIRDDITVPLEHFVGEVQAIITASYPFIRRKMVAKYCKAMLLQNLHNCMVTAVPRHLNEEWRTWRPVHAAGLAHLLLTDALLKLSKELVSASHAQQYPTWTENVLHELRPAAGDVPESYVAWEIKMHNCLKDGEYLFQSIDVWLDVYPDQEGQLFKQQQHVVEKLRRKWWQPW